MQSMHSAAVAAIDFNIIGLLSEDIIALEAKYHTNFYKIYTKITTNDSKASSTVSKYKEIEMKAFQEVVTHCHYLSISPSCYSFSAMQKIMEDVFRSNNLVMTASTKKT